LHPRWSTADARARADELEHELRGEHWRTAALELAAPGPVARWEAQLRGGERRRTIAAYLLRVRTCRADGSVEPSFDGEPGAAPPGCVPWFALPERAWATHTAVFGHWAALGLELGANHIGLDTGCVWGKTLTALRLPDRAVFQIKAAEVAS
jgi:bis(5'-nucleosyl)-tetraphosphatase (symmetrical)